MSNNIYFEVYWVNRERKKAAGLAVRLPATDRVRPGDRIKELTRAAKKVVPPAGLLTRTQMLVSAPADSCLKPLSDYLWADKTFNGGRFIRHLDRMVLGEEPHLFLSSPGAPVSGHDFVGRNDKVDEVLDKLKSGISCHLRAPRRYGKTSLLMCLKEIRPDSVFIDVCDAGSMSGFLKALLRDVMKYESGRNSLSFLQEYRAWPMTENLYDFNAFNMAFNSLIGNKTEFEINRLIQNIFTALADSGVALFIDEFSVFLRELQEKSDDALVRFLTVFSEVRRRKNAPLACILAGSAGLNAYIQFLDLTAYFDDLVFVDLPPVSEEVARMLIEEVFYGMGKIPSPPVIQKAMDLTGGDEVIPYFLHALANVAAAEVGARESLFAEDIEKAYYNRLLGPQGSIFFRDFLLREKAYPNTCRPGALAALKMLALRFPYEIAEKDLRACFNRECAYQKLITCLEEDYDLVRSGEGFRMRSKVLADRWRLGEPWDPRGE